MTTLESNTIYDSTIGFLKPIGKIMGFAFKLQIMNKIPFEEKSLLSIHIYLVIRSIEVCLVPLLHFGKGYPPQRNIGFYVRNAPPPRFQ